MNGRPGWQGAFGSAASWFAAVLPHAVARLDEPGLVDYTDCDLVGRTSRSLITAEVVLTDETSGGSTPPQPRLIARSAPSVPWRTSASTWQPIRLVGSWVTS